MFRNRSLGLVVVLAVLMLVMLIFGTAVSKPPVALSAKGASNAAYAANLIDWYLQHGGSGYRDDASNDTASVIPARSEGYAALKDAQFEKSDAAQLAGAGIMTADEADSYSTMQPFTSGWWEYRDDSLTNKWSMDHYSTTPTGPVIDATYEMASDTTAVQVQPKGYAALKEAQLVQIDARIGPATFPMPAVPSGERCNLDRKELVC